MSSDPNDHGETPEDELRDLLTCHRSAFWPGLGNLWHNFPIFKLLGHTWTCSRCKWWVMMWPVFDKYDQGNNYYICHDFILIIDVGITITNHPSIWVYYWMYMYWGWWTMGSWWGGLLLWYLHYLFFLSDSFAVRLLNFLSLGINAQLVHNLQRPVSQPVRPVTRKGNASQQWNRWLLMRNEELVQVCHHRPVFNSFWLSVGRWGASKWKWVTSILQVQLVRYFNMLFELWSDYL